MKKKIYIASPYTKGDVAVNVRRQMDAFNLLISMGHSPFAPLLAHFVHIVHPRSYEDWMDWDLHWIESCDAVLRLEGESEGADREVARAIALGIKVYYNISEFLRNE